MSFRYSELAVALTDPDETTEVGPEFTDEEVRPEESTDGEAEEGCEEGLEHTRSLEMSASVYRVVIKILFLVSCVRR